MQFTKYRFLCALAALAVPLSVQAAPGYAYTAVALSPEKGGAYGLSNSGNVTGRLLVGNQEMAFLYSNKGFVALPAGTHGTGVNNAGQVVGSWADRAFLYSRGEMTALGPDNTSSWASDINDAGAVAGWVYLGANPEAFLYRDGVMKGLGSLPGGDLQLCTRDQQSGTGCRRRSVLQLDPGGHGGTRLPL